MKTVITKRSVGIAWDDRRVAACIVRAGIAQFVVEDIIVVPRDPARPLEEDLRSVSERMGGSLEICVAALFEADIMYRRVTRPFADRTKIRQTLGPEVEAMLPVLDSPPVFDFILTGRDAEGANVVQALCAKTSSVTRLVDILKGSLLEPEIVDCPSVALAHGARTLFDMPDLTPVVVLYIGLAETSVSILQNRDIRCVGTVPIGYERIAGEGGKAGGPAQEQPQEGKEHACENHALAELFREVFIMVERAALHDSAALVIPSGYAEKISDLDKSVRDILGMEVFRPALKDDVSYEGDAVKLREELLAVSLACRGVTEGDPVNFRQGQVGVKRRLSRMVGVAGPWIKAALVLFVLWTAGLVLDVALKARMNAQLGHLIQEEFASVMPKGTPMVDPVAQMEQYLKRLNAQSGPGDGTAGGTPLEVLRDLSASLPSGVDLTIESLAMDEETITISGSTSRYEDVEKIQTLLTGLSYVGDVKILSANVDKNDQRVKMRLSCKRKV